MALDPSKVIGGAGLNAPTGFNNVPPVAQSLLNNAASNITGILSTRPTAKYASGARCTLKINDRIVGFAFAISWHITTQVTEIRTIDNYMPYELTPSLITVEGTISALHIPGQGVGVYLWQPDVLNFLSQQYITIEARDSATDQLLFYTGQAMITSRAQELRIDQLSNTTLTWRAIGFRDERNPASPSNLNYEAEPGGQADRVQQQADFARTDIDLGGGPTTPQIPSDPTAIPS